MNNNPMFEPKANEAVTIKPLKNFKNGQSKRGDDYYGWEIEDTADGAKYSWFIYDEGVHQEILALHKTGQQAVVTLKLAKGKKPWYEVKAAFFDGKGNVNDPPKPALDTPEGLEAYRKKMKNTLYMAVEDVIAVKLKFAEEWKDAKEAERIFTPDVIQKYATSIVIDYSKRT